MPNNARTELIDQLTTDIAREVGNMPQDELEGISSSFDKALADALSSFNSSAFDDDGFIKRMRDLDLDEKGDKGLVKNVLNGMRSDYVTMDAFNQSELLLRRDLNNICQQMPEMRDVVYIIRDAIIESNVATGEVSRSLIFENHDDNESFESIVKDVENRHDLLMAIKNFIVPNTLRSGEMYIHVVPYAKLFAEMESMNGKHDKDGKSHQSSVTGFKESVPQDVMDSFYESHSLYSESNVKFLVESMDPSISSASADEYKISHSNETPAQTKKESALATESISALLRNIDVCNGSSVMMNEIGPEGFRQFFLSEYARDQAERRKVHTDKEDPGTHFIEAMGFGSLENNTDFGKIDQDDVDVGTYDQVKGCYVKYLDTLRMVPIRIDRRVVGYYYITTTADIQNNPGNPNGTVDLSFQQYTRDRNMVEKLASLIINSFDKKFLERNIKLKNEIAEIIMAHKFSEGRLSFVYISETDVVRLLINEDEEGKGHSILEPTMFPARMYLLLTLYNMLYTLNNNTTHIHYLRSSGLNKDYAAQIQRTMRKFQQRRITIDDIYSYSGVLNKIGGMGEMVLPSGRSDIRALEHDTIEAVNNPVNVEFLEQQRRQAISGTGVPHLMVINAIDEVDFAKTLELANTRFLSTVSSYKIDFNRGITKLYQKLLRWDSDMEDDIIRSFKFKFNAIKQQDLVITTEMIQNFNQLVEFASSLYYTKKQLEDDDGEVILLNLRREMAKTHLPQLNFDEMDDIIRRVDAYATDDKLKTRVSALKIEDSDLQEVES